MTEEQKALLEMVAEELGGTLTYWTCVDKYSSLKKIVIEYGQTKNESPSV
jgi:hypothetical protein